jgi:putative endonuclease
VRNKRQNAERRGQLAEHVALWFLRFKGYRLLVRRYKSPAGEVDLIMRRGATTIFVEVKARSTVDEAVISVTKHQSRRISGAAAFYTSRDQIAAQGFCRFDIVAVPSYLWPSHIKNAFEGSR